MLELLNCFIKSNAAPLRSYKNNAASDARIEIVALASPPGGKK